MGCGYIPNQFVGLLWLGRSAQTPPKAKTGDRAPTGRIKAQSSQNANYYLKPVQNASVHAPTPQLQFGFKCSYFVCQVENSCNFPLKGQIEIIEQAEYAT